MISNMPNVDKSSQHGLGEFSPELKNKYRKSLW